MRTIRALGLALLVLGLLMPGLAADAPTAAAPAAIVGSLTITGAGGSALTTEVAGYALVPRIGSTDNGEVFLSNENPFIIQIPPFSLPIVISVDPRGGSTTILYVQNAGASALVIELTLRDGAGTPLTPSPVTETLGAHATRVISVSDLLLP